jgi:hypothetical protein
MVQRDPDKMKPGAKNAGCAKTGEAYSRASLPLRFHSETRLLLFEPIVTME